MSLTTFWFWHRDGMSNVGMYFTECELEFLPPHRNLWLCFLYNPYGEEALVQLTVPCHIRISPAYSFWAYYLSLSLKNSLGKLWIVSVLGYAPNQWSWYHCPSSVLIFCFATSYIILQVVSGATSACPRTHINLTGNISNGFLFLVNGTRNVFVGLTDRSSSTHHL